MAAEVMFKQCVLRNKSTTQVAWIPESLAIRGKTLKIKEDHQWVDGWKVIFAAEFSAPESQVNTMSQEYKKHRSVTDI